MRIDEKSIFETKPGCRLRKKEIIVLKSLQEEGEEKYFYFYAVSSAPYFDRFVELARSTKTHRYKHQVAYIICSRGWIEQLTVFERTLGPGRAENARGCGIGVVLTELCLIDPAIHSMETMGTGSNKQENNGLVILPRELRERVKNECFKIVGMVMNAKTDSGGHAYFSAAIRMGFNKLIVDQLLLDPSEIRDIKIYDTQVAKQNYKDGVIEECCNNERCTAYRSFWVFCGGS